MHISLKDGTINIGGGSAPVIRTMVGPNLLDPIAGGAVFSNRAHSVFTISKTSVRTKPTVISSISTGVFFPVNQAVLLKPGSPYCSPVSSSVITGGT